MTIREQDWMMAWVSLAHAGTYLTDSLGASLREELGFGLAEQDLLKQVAVNGGELTMTELARRLYYSKAGITKMVDRLERDGLLERNPSKSDRRAIQIHLTRKGEKAFAQSRKILMQFVTDNFRAHLNDEEIIQLGNSLRALLTGLGRFDGQLKHLRGEASRSGE